MAMVRIEQWSVVTDPFKAPELGVLYLHGNVYWHPKHTDGRDVTTSKIIGVTEDNLVLTQSGTLYQLGEVNPEYEKIYPNARERFFASAKRIK